MSDQQWIAGSVALMGLAAAAVVLLVVWYLRSSWRERNAALERAQRSEAALAALERRTEREAERKRQAAAAVERQCGNCVHFDLEEGQATLQSSPVFQQVMANVTPHRMGTAQYDESGDETDEETRNKVPVRTRWSEFGACAKLNQTIWREDQEAATCPHFVAETNLAKRKKQWAKSESAA